MQDFRSSRQSKTKIKEGRHRESRQKSQGLYEGGPSGKQKKSWNNKPITNIEKYFQQTLPPSLLLKMFGKNFNGLDSTVQP